MRHVSDAAGGSLAYLPPNVIKHLLQRRYPDGIAGTHGDLAVCSAWRDAAPASKPQDLLIVVDELDQEQLLRVGSWLQAFPTACQDLELRSCWWEHDTLGFTGIHGVAFLLGALQQGLAALPPPAAVQQLPAAQQLTRLCLDGNSSLLLVAPLLPQLHVLQHLEAGLCMHIREASVMDEDPGFFSTADEQPLEQLPDVSAAAALTSLQLTFEVPYKRMIMDERLPQLLPATLRQLHLVVEDHIYPHLAAAHLTHLTELRSLTLCEFHVIGWDLLLSKSSSLQQLAILQPGYTARTLDAALTAAAAPLLVEVCHLTFNQLRIYSSAFTQLRSLYLYSDQDDATDTAVLQQLTTLTELHIHLYYQRKLPPWVAAALQSCAAMQQLRAVGLSFHALGPDQQLAPVAAALGALTQLTSLQLALTAVAGKAPWAEALATLTGLQQLHVQSPGYLKQQQWLAPLTALQRLAIQDQDDIQLEDLLPQLVCVAPTLELLVVGVDVTQVKLLQQALPPALAAAVPGLQMLVVPSGAPDWWSKLSSRAPHLPGAWRPAAQ